MKRYRWFVPVIVVLLFAAACSSDDDSATTAEGVCDGEITASTIEVWANEGSEADAYRALAESFNATKGAELGVTANLTLIPDADYTASITSAAAAGDLPDAMLFDGPTQANYAWAGTLKPIEECISDELRDNLLPSLLEQGVYDDVLYSVGTFDSGLGLYAWRSALESVGATIPTEPEDAWTVEEFTQILRDLQAAGFAHPLDIKVFYGSQGEWFTYAFAPVLWSGGGDLIDRDDYQSADGVLNSEESVEALTTFQGWVNEELTATNAVDDAGFLSGEDSALAWVGHWNYQLNKDALGDDMVVVPLPDFGEGTRTGMGSWAWGVTSAGAANDGDAAWAFIDYALTDDVILEVTGVNGAVPATRTALEKSPIYAEGGDLEIFVKQLEGAPDVAMPRPVTPAYTNMTTEFRVVIDKIILGADVKTTLDEAVAVIDADIAANDGYPPPSEQ